MDIKNSIQVPPMILNALTQNILSSAASGISTGPYGSTIHLSDATLQNEFIAEAILNGFETLALDQDVTSIQADGIEAGVVTCSDPQIAAQSNVNYLVLLDGIEYAAGAASVTGGAVEIELITDTPGTYTIIIWHKTTYASGYKVIEAA